MGKLGEALAGQEENRGGQPHHLPRLMAKMDPEDVAEFREYMDSDVQPALLYRAMCEVYPDLAWPAQSSFYRWVADWRTKGRRF